jgi:hypothetical protein
MTLCGQIGHSARHEDMEISLLTEQQANVVLTQPLEMGLHKHLADQTVKTVQEHHKRIYGCRHCTQRRPNTVADEPMEVAEPTPHPAANPPGAVEPNAANPHHAPEAEPKLVLRDFNALRSHAKAK